MEKEKKEKDTENSKKQAVKSSTPKCIWVNITNTHYPIIRQVVEELGYKITESDTKPLLFWYDSGGQLEIASSLELWQFYNHFPSIWSISRKVELAKNIERMQKSMPRVFTFHPKTFLLPGQYGELRSFMLSISKSTKRTFIIKPDAGSQGKGIILVQNPDQIEDYYESAVAQQYISPFLIDGYKFDLRIYALLTSVDPLRIYIHKEGMARFCTEKYVKPKQSNLYQVYSHLTNYSLNKKNENFQNPDDFNACIDQVENDEKSEQEAVDRSEMPENDKGSKRSLSSIYRDIEKMGYSTTELKNQIDNIICLTIGSVQPFLAHNYHTAISANDGKSRCFEILGFDILIDKHLNPWLLEVNCMPSLSTDSQFDKELKHSVVKGALKIVSLQPNFKKIVTNRQKAETQKRLINVNPNPSSDTPIKQLFNPQKETEIAKTTNWRQIYPPTSPNLQISTIMESVLIQAKETPVGAAVETVASRARKEAVIKQIREQEQKAKMEKLKAGNKRPPFSTDTTTPITNTNGKSSGCSNKKKYNYLANIVQKPASKKITRVKLAPHSSRSKESESHSHISSHNSALLNTKQTSIQQKQQLKFDNLSVFDCGNGVPINPIEEGERKKFISEQIAMIKNLNIDECVTKIAGKPVTPSNQKKSIQRSIRKNEGSNQHSALDNFPGIAKPNKKIRQVYGAKPVLKPVLMCMNP